MTCCGGNIAGAFLLLLAIAVVAALLLLAGTFLVIALAQRRRGRPSRGLMRLAAGFGVVAVGVPLALFAWATVAADPRVLRLDLRGDRPVSMLESEQFPGFAGTWRLDSERIDLRLPDERRLQTKVVSTVFHADGRAHDSQIDDFEIRGPAEPVPRAERRVRDWSEQLRADADGLDRHQVREGQDWEDTLRTEHLQIEVSLQAVRDGKLAIARADVAFHD